MSPKLNLCASNADERLESRDAEAGDTDAGGRDMKLTTPIPSAAVAEGKLKIVGGVID